MILLTMIRPVKIGVERYHYLGYTPLPGAQLRYFVMLDQQITALLGFGAAAWQAAPRDNYIGWPHTLRKRQLLLVIDNARFLILPWVQVKYLASKMPVPGSDKSPGRLDLPAITQA
jgi:hypothetical protein